MYYSELVKKACAILYDAHRDDLDKGGYPYVFHPFYLATQMDDEASTCVALLHDVIETTTATGTLWMICAGPGSRTPSSTRSDC